MKRFLTVLVFLAAMMQLSAQTATSSSTTSPNSRRPLWVGLDMGGTWQSSDMKAVGGIGWSFTMSRYSRLDKTGPLYFGWRFRFLDGRNYGYNYHSLGGVANDPALNGMNNPHVNYSNSPEFFSNYKFRNDEFSYELIVGSNGLRKHGVLLYGFGGLGLDHWRTTTNQLDALGQQYNYSGIDLSGNDAVVSGPLKSMWMNGDYETVANGSTSGGKWNFMPNAGIGFGYQWSNAVALGVEHRTTWALNDYIDGVNHNSAGGKTPNDVWNYDGLFVRWTFGGGHSNSHSTYNTPPPNNPNNYTNQNPNNPNNTYHPTDPIVTNPTNPNTNNSPIAYPPVVRFITPSVNPYTTSQQNQQLVVDVEHINFSSQITLMINNQISTNFSFNPNTNTMVFNHVLNSGTNTYQVTASNSAGTASDAQTIIYQVVVNNNGNNNPLPPSVIISNPAADPYTSPTQTTPVSATVLNVQSVSGIIVRKNGNSINGWSFDPNTHLVTFVANLSNGSNLYEVIGSNAVGSASDAVTINYNPLPTILPPVVTITNPTACPAMSKNPNLTITANITNVTTASQVAILFNNQTVSQFNFVNNGTYATVSFPAVLVAGVNPFSVRGTNSAGTDIKSCDVTLKSSTQNPPVPPVVTITDPSTSPYTTQNATYTVKATVLNVGSSSEITVSQNNATVTNWMYNMSTHILMLPANLISGNNVFTVTASNVNGSDTKSTTIIYSAPALAPPVVNITVPSADPFITSTPNQSLQAEVLNVTTSSEITVTEFPSGSVPFNFNPGTHMVTFSVVLGQPATQYIVTATNAAGTASDHTTLKLIDTQSGTSTSGNTPPVPVALTLVNPNAVNYSTTNSSISISMLTAGITSASELTVRINNVQLFNFNYDGNSHMISFNASLNSGSNTIVVVASNTHGSASQTLDVTYAATRSNSNSSSNSSTESNGNSSRPREESSSTISTRPSSDSKPNSETKPTANPQPNSKPRETPKPTPAPATSGRGTPSAPAAPKPR